MASPEEIPRPPRQAAGHRSCAQGSGAPRRPHAPAPSSRLSSLGLGALPLRGSGGGLAFGRRESERISLVARAPQVKWEPQDAAANHAPGAKRKMSTLSSNLQAEKGLGEAPYHFALLLDMNYPERDVCKTMQNPWYEFPKNESARVLENLKT